MDTTPETTGQEGKDDPSPDTIWAIGGGKGGIGKTVLTANLGIALAQAGRRVVMVDLDLGGANLHAVLGIMSPALSIKQYIHRDKDNMRQVILDTEVEGLYLISGAGDTLGMANLAFTQKQQIIAELRRLDADHVLLDLGAGTSFNVLDYFSITNDGIVVTTPEAISAMNAFGFIRAAVFRKLERTFRRDSQLYELIKSAKDPQNPDGISTVDELCERVAEADPESLEPFRAALRRFRPRLIVNRVTRAEDVQIGETIQALAAKHLSVEVEQLGHVEDSPEVGGSVAALRPLLLESPSSRPAASIRTIGDRLLRSSSAAVGAGSAAATWRWTDLESEKRAALQEILRELREADGYMGAALMTPVGEVLAQDRWDTALDLASVASTFNQLFQTLGDATVVAGLGRCSEVVIDGRSRVVLLKRFPVGPQDDLHIVAVANGYCVLMGLYVMRLLPKIIAELEELAAGEGGAAASD